MKTKKDTEDLENIIKSISDIQDNLNRLIEEITELHVFGSNQQKIEQELNKIQQRVDENIKKSKSLITSTKQKYLKEQNLIPSDIEQELNSLELLSESVQGAMDERNREFKRAKTIRTEYLSGVDEIQSWLQKTELKIQDRTLEPLHLKEILNKINQEIGGITDRLEAVKKNGQVIIEKCRNDEEKILIQTTIEQLQQQLDQVKSWLDEKKQQVGDTLDAWSRFMSLYQIVMTWVADKKSFMEEPLHLTNLQQTRQKLNDYSVINFIFFSVCRRILIYFFYYRLLLRVLNQLLKI